jgi:hypothetical protein
VAVARYLVNSLQPRRPVKTLQNFTYELKCSLCRTKVFSFSPWAVSVLLEEHMEDRHPANKPPKHGEDLRLTLDDANFLKSAGITPWK